MKKILALIAISVASIALAVADPIVIGHGYLGFGALGTTFNYDEMVEYGTEDEKPSVFGAFFSNLEYGAGASINIPFGGYFGVQAGVDFYVNSAGFKTDEHNYTFTYTSLDIPLLFTAKLEKWNFALGPYLSIPLGNVTATRDTSGSLTYKNGRKVNFGITAGVGYEERMGMGRIVFGGRYMLDFLDNFVDDPDNVAGKSEFNFTRRSLLIDVGYKLPLSFFGL